ncbi:MAG: hypothetical protein H6741_33315 [Alphaproteobacteria bacterium]|nr:hypothetical protein [Alphaproteobacteria bacterium]
MVIEPHHWLYLGVLALVVIERLYELRLSARNAAWAFERGGVERGQGHFGVMKALHTLFLIACPLEVWLLDRPFIPALAALMGAALIGTMGLRYWAITTLGPRWNTRVICVPGLAAVEGGPYRFIRHPNYVAVVIELAALPLFHSAWLTALVFGLANLALLRTRIRVEEDALRELCEYEAGFGGRPRFLPGGET